ncbi:MAG: 2-oxoglutarate and iron-dependent oxygenase domain-containing protein, partial [Pseudomonadota bacterium]
MQDGPSAETYDATVDQRALTLDDAQLPVIDLSPLTSADPQAKARVAAALGEAARTSGFFYVTGHGVPQALIDGVLAASREFHGQPRSAKMKNWCGFSSHHRGYVPFEENGSDFPKRINFNEAWDMSWEAPADHPDSLHGWRM